MTTELRLRNQSQQLYVRALSSAWRNGIQLWDPSIWLIRDPEVEEKMLRDADIAHAIEYRQRLIAGLQWSVESRRDSPRGPMAVSVATELIEGIQDFTQARFALSRAFFSGERFAKIHGCPKRLKIGDGKERVWWVPTSIEDQDKRLYRIVPDVSGDRINAHWERWDIGKQVWVPQTVAEAVTTIRHVYNDLQGTLHHGTALREALGWWWYAKTHVLQESLQAVERFAQGILTAKVDGARDATTGLPNTDLINAWRDVLEDLRARHVLVYDAADQIEVVSMDASGEALLTSIRDELKSTIFTLVLGANLTTGASEGGSYALADVQENSTESIVAYDRQALEDCLSRSLLGAIWNRNWANLVELDIVDEKPRLSLQQEKRENPVERSQVAATLFGMGVPLAMAEVYEQTGFRPPEPGEDVLQRTAQQIPGDPAGLESRPGGLGNIGGALGGEDLGDLGGIDRLGDVKSPFENLTAQLRATREALLRFDQARVPAGSPEGGEFAPGHGSSATHPDAPKKRKAVTGDMVPAKREGKTWVMDDGSPLPDHLRGVNIPPGLNNVRIATDENAELLVRGSDAKGREKRIYSDSYNMHQAGAKFSRINELMIEQSRIKEQIDAALASGNDHAAVAALIFSTGIRPGSDRDTGGKVKAYGATTLEGRHVVSGESGVLLDFIGKEGVHLQIPIQDPDIAAMLVARAEKAGQDGRIFDTSDGRLRDWAKANLDSGRFTPKDFRTLKGTTAAIKEIESDPNRSTTAKEHKRRVMDVAKKVSALLGNTPAMALKAYIDPNVFAAWSPA